MLGTVSRVSRVSDVLEMLYEHEEEQFSTKRPATQSSFLAVAPSSLLLSRAADGGGESKTP